MTQTSTTSANAPGGNLQRSEASPDLKSGEQLLGAVSGGSAVVDRISTAELIKRYGLTSRSSILRWLNGLEIRPYKEGKQFYISRSHLGELDELASCLRSGKTLSQCLDIPHDVHVPVALASISSALPTEQSALSQLVREIAAALRQETSDTLALKQNPIEHWFVLERATHANFLLKSKEVQQLIGVKPAGDRMTRGSFIFIRAGKIGSSTAWRIEKL